MERPQQQAGVGALNGLAPLWRILRRSPGPSFKPAHGPSLFHLVFIVVRRNNWWSMGSKVGKNMKRVRAMVSISFYLYEVGSARAPKGFPWWTAGMKIDPRVPNTLIRKDYSIVNFTNIYSVSTQIRYLSKPQKWYSWDRLLWVNIEMTSPR